MQTNKKTHLVGFVGIHNKVVVDRHEASLPDALVGGDVQVVADDARVAGFHL